MGVPFHSSIFPPASYSNSFASVKVGKPHSAPLSGSGVPHAPVDVQWEVSCPMALYDDKCVRCADELPFFLVCLSMRAASSNPYERQKARSSVELLNVAL